LTAEAAQNDIKDPEFKTWVRSGEFAIGIMVPANVAVASGRTRSWAKSLVSSKTEAQRLADEFMETANERNNQPQLFPSGKESVAGLVEFVAKRCGRC
jgi:hypothetical protein